MAFFWPDMNTKMNVVIIYMYLKHFPDYIDSEYIWVHGSNSIGCSVSTEIPFLAFFSLTQGKEEVWPGETQPMLMPE